MQWDKVVLVGWSDGASAATYLGRDQAVAGLIAISGPKYKEWLLDARQTPGCAHRLVYHQEETLPDETLALLIDGLDLDPTVVDVDTSSPPYGDAQILTTAHTDFRADHCTVHKAVAMDPCLPEALFETYLHLACAAPTACPP
jgi:pimeloyl-ACP methyl ester carboxylesterase